MEKRGMIFDLNQDGGEKIENKIYMEGKAVFEVIK
jgi:hypothetical protein